MQTPFVLPPGFVTDDTTFNAPGRWRDGQMVRFFEGSWQVRAGWEQLTLDLLGGVCRAVFPWTDNEAVLNIAFGTHATLEIWQSGVHENITPQVSESGAAPDYGVTTFIGQNAVGVREPTFRTVGDLVTISGVPVPTGGLNLNGTWTVDHLDNGQPDVWYFEHPAAANADDGSNATVVTFTANIPPGQIDGTGGSGFGTGAYGIGGYSEPSTDDYFPRTWSLGAFGSWLIANPRAGTIYVWKNDPAVRAQPLLNAPAEVTYTICVPQRQVMALGCNEEISGVFNPLAIRFSDIENSEDWATLPDNNAGEVILPGGGRIVCGRVIGNYVYVWTDRALFLGTFVGSPQQTWRFDKVADNCGAVSPGSPVIKNQVALWIASDAQFYTCQLGGVPVILPCPIRLDFVENITPGQYDKIVGSTISTWGEVTWFYPDVRDGFENSRDLTTSPQGWWCRGRLARTAFCDASPQPYPIGVGPKRMAFWHEKGASEDGAPITGFIESCDFYLNDAAGGVMVNGVWPDFREQQGVFNLTIFTRERAQGPERQHGPYALTPRLGQKSFRLAGRIARLRYDFSSAPCSGRAGKQEFDVQSIGGR